jgi:hypothetical protein
LSVTFEPGSKLSCIEHDAFWKCFSLSRISLPGGLHQIGPAAFGATNLQEVSIADGASLFKVSAYFLMDIESTTIAAFFGTATEVTIPTSVEKLSGGCFSERRKLRHVTFEPGCRLSCIETITFSYCFSLSSICIPAAVTRLCEYCFEECRSLWSVTFEAGSRLSVIEYGAFSDCTALSSICIPSSVQRLCRSAFARCCRLANVAFESNAKLAVLENGAFSDCESLSSIQIPSSVQRHLFSEYEWSLVIVTEGAIPASG